MLYMGVVTISRELNSIINKSGTYERFEDCFLSHTPPLFNFQLSIKAGYGKMEELEKICFHF